MNVHTPPLSWADWKDTLSPSNTAHEFVLFRFDILFDYLEFVFRDLNSRWETADKLFVVATAKQAEDEPIYLLKYDDGIDILLRFDASGINVSVSSEKPLVIDWKNLFHADKPSETSNELFSRLSYSENHSNFSLKLSMSDMLPVFFFLLENRIR